MATLARQVKIALISDLHYGAHSPVPERRSEIADILLTRAVSRLNRLVRPDVTLVLGDLVDNGAAPDASERLSQLRTILDRLDAPYIAIPGNHDRDPESFYRVFDRPSPVEDLCGLRFVPFVDTYAPGFNAYRSPRALQRFREARSGHLGPIVALQHVCLFPPDRPVAPYNYTNASEITEGMREAGISLSVSGHYHPGAEIVRDGDMTFVNAPALSEGTFPFTVVTIDGGRIETRRHELAMPKSLRLADNHLHTELAFCSHNMTVEAAISLADTFGLAALRFAEHAGQLYFDRRRFWDRVGHRDGMVAARAEENRVSDYLDLKLAHEADSVVFGLEADCDYHGNLLLRPGDRDQFDYIVGTVHSLPSLRPDTPPSETDFEDFLSLLDRLLANRIDVLAHPFRILRRSGAAPPADLFLPTARLLRKHDVAAEINFHRNEPPIEFVRTCLDLGVKLSFASDAHDLSEIGDFAYHLALLEDAGFDGDLSDILSPLAPPAQVGCAFS